MSHLLLGRDSINIRVNIVRVSAVPGAEMVEMLTLPGV